jgi:hypothetical protein
MNRIVVIATLFVTGAAHADKYAEMDKARVAIIAALDTGDDKAFAVYVGKDFKTERVWFDTAACRKRFSNATVKAKDAKAFVACFKGLGVRAQGLLIHYGPDVSLSARISVDEASNKATLDRLSGDVVIDKTLPPIWRATFEAHRKPGAQPVKLDAAAAQEIADIGDTGVVFEACVDAKGNVSKVSSVMNLPKTGPTMKQVLAATKTWQFEPFMIKGKPAAACGTQLVKLAP